MLRALRNVRRDDTDARRMAWLLWANHVLAELPHLKRTVALPAPEKIDDWVKMRQLGERQRRPRTKLKGTEIAVLADVGDYVEQLRLVEIENAATLECLLHAAWLLWDANGNQPNAGAETIYEHVLNAWGVMPPPVESLPATRDEVRRLCEGYMRESDLVPDWYFNSKYVPYELRKTKPDEEPQTTVTLYGGVDP